MARVKQRVYMKSKERTMQSMLEVCEHTFAELGMEIRTQYLDKALIEVSGTPPRGSPLGKKNVLTVYKEEDKIFIKLTYDMKDPDQFWDVFETNLNIYGANTEEIAEKSMIVRKICETIAGMGTIIDPEEVWDFLYHYEKNLKKLPEDNEIDEISIEYIKMKNEMSAHVPNEDVFVEEPQMDQTASVVDDLLIEDEFGEVQVTRTEALIEIVKEIPTLDKEAQNYVISLFERLLVDDQERLVQKVQIIENDLNRVPYLLPGQRKELRKQVMQMDQAKRRKFLGKEIKKRQANQAEYMMAFTDYQVRQGLADLPTVSETEVEEILNIILTMPFEVKKNIVGIIQEIDNEIQKLIHEHGMKFSAQEAKDLRMDLIRLDRNERKKRFENIVEDFRKERVESLLFKEIPQLRFEEGVEKTVKEMIWLDRNEVMQRIQNIKQKMEEQTKKKSEVFQKSSAGSACPKCGWPMGKFSKKCVRCGYNTDDEWFDL